MSVASLLKALLIVVVVALVLTAYFEPSALAFVRHRASHNALWLLLGLMAAACGAKLTLAIPVFGANAHVTAPLLLMFAAPYLLRATGFKPSALAPLGLMTRKPHAATGAKPRRPVPNSDMPAALPARIATALEAAARARR